MSTSPFFKDLEQYHNSPEELLQKADEIIQSLLADNNGLKEQLQTEKINFGILSFFFSFFSNVSSSILILYLMEIV
jgi:hypothetical protein